MLKEQKTDFSTHHLKDFSLVEEVAFKWSKVNKNVLENYAKCQLVAGTNADYVK